MTKTNDSKLGVKIGAGSISALSVLTMTAGYYSGAIEYIALGFVLLAASILGNLAAYLGPSGVSEIGDVPNPVSQEHWQTRADDAEDHDVKVRRFAA